MMIDRLQWRAPICVAALALCLVVAGPVSAQQAADSIWFGGPILTMNDQAMRAEAVAEAGGKIIAVGRRSDIMKLNGPATQLVDLKGRILVFGFVDVHGHIVVGGLQALFGHRHQHGVEGRKREQAVGQHRDDEVGPSPSSPRFRRLPTPAPSRCSSTSIR